MYGTGTAAVQSGQVSTSNGSKQSIRIDTSSVTAIASLTGTLMSCGTGQYPTSGYTSAIDHSQSIVGTDQLQLVNGTFQTPGVGTGYKDYSDYYFPSTLSQPNYSSISSSGYRYLCLRYQSLKTSTYDSVTVTFSCTGLTLTPASDTANFRLYLKVVDSTTTPWVSATAAIGASGYDAISSDGQGAMDNSNASISGGSASMRIYVPTGTSASSTVYLRLGLDMTQSQYVSGIALTAN